MSYCYSISASSMVLAPHRASSSSKLFVNVSGASKKSFDSSSASCFNVLLDKVLMQCYTSPVTAPIFLMVLQRIFSTHFAATFYRLDETSLGGTS
jgi:hypothetical protein